MNARAITKRKSRIRMREMEERGITEGAMKG